MSRGEAGSGTGSRVTTRHTEDRGRREERKRLERVDIDRRALERHLRAGRRLESLGALAGALAHDFNNLLTPIVGTAGLLRADLPEDSPLHHQVEMIRRAARRASELTAELLTASRDVERATTRFDVSRLIEELELLIEAAAGEGAELIYDLDADLPEVRACLGQVARIVIDMVACMAELSKQRDPRIRLVTRSVEADRALLQRFRPGAECEEGRYVCIEVEGEGVSLPEASGDVIFDGFFSSRFPGLGVGLAGVLAQVKAEGGAIRLAELERGGLCVRALVPSAEQVDAESGLGGAAVTPASPSQSGCILVVDDDEGARELTAILLDRAGYETDVASDGAEAIAIHRARRDEIGGVVLDLTMPGMSGAEVFEALRQQAPDLPIVVVSGYAKELIPAPLQASPGTRFLRKPFEPDQLVRSVRELIEER